MANEADCVRSGYVAAPDLERLLEAFRSDVLRQLVGFLFWSGWRCGSVKELTWQCIDREGGIVFLPRERTKNNMPVQWGLVGALGKIIDQREAARNRKSPYVFHRHDGKPIRCFRRAWKSATTRAGLAGLVPHDLRRSLALAHLEAGVPREVTMAGAGWRSESVYQRYAIVPKRVLCDAQALAAAQHERSLRRAEPEERSSAAATA